MIHIRAQTYLTKGKSCLGVREENGKLVIREYANLNTPIVAEGNSYQELWEHLCPKGGFDNAA